MSEKDRDDEIIELTEDELSEILEDDDFDSEGEYDQVQTFYFSNPDPYAKVAPRPDDAPKREVSFDEKGNIVVKNPSAFWPVSYTHLLRAFHLWRLPDVRGRDRPRHD